MRKALLAAATFSFCVWGTVVFAGTTLQGTVQGAATQLVCSDLGNAAASCSTDATNASNITSGTLAAARGGAGTVTGALKGNGSGVVSQAACADLSNAAASCSTDATNASNISSGTLASARGGAGTINGALKGNGSGVVSQAACADLSNAAASCSTDATNADNISSGTLAWSLQAHVPAATRTTNFTIPATSFWDGTWFDTTGASAEVDFTLPTSPFGQQKACFVNAAAQTLKVIAPASTDITIGTTTSAAAGNITNTTGKYAVACLYALTANHWVSDRITGGWTVN